jgi:hypothetical protein
VVQKLNKIKEQGMKLKNKINQEKNKKITNKKNEYQIWYKN